MAFSVEEISQIIAGDGEVSDVAKEIATKIISLHEDDVKGLKGTNLELKDEKRKLKERYDAEIAKFAETEKDYQEQVRLAKEAASSGSSEEQKKYYDTQLARLEEIYKSQLTMKDKTISEKESELVALQRKDLIRSQEAEFYKEVQKTNAAPVMFDVLKNMVIGQGDNFAPHDTPDGTVFWATDSSGETMRNRLDKILASEQGKHFVVFNSSGSGAEGSSRTSGYSGVNPFKTGNLTEQQRLYREDPKLYESLKKEALR